MGYRDILVHVDSTKPGSVRLSLAIALAKRFDARLSGIHIVPTPNVPPVYRSSTVERVAEGYAEAARKAAAKSEALFRDRVTNLGLATDYQEAEGDIAEHLRQASRFVDLIIVGQDDTENPPGIEPFLLPERVVFGCAAPVLVVPIRFMAEAIGRSVLVGWDGSGQAARAIRDALPFLREARTVTVVAVDPDRQGHLTGGAHAPGMVARLARQGINVVGEDILSGQRDAAEVLLARAADLGADMMVMGAYGHMRLKEFILGGTTPGIVEQTAIPVIMSH